MGAVRTYTQGRSGALGSRNPSSALQAQSPNPLGAPLVPLLYTRNLICQATFFRFFVVEFYVWPAFQSVKFHRFYLSATIQAVIFTHEGIQALKLIIVMFACHNKTTRRYVNTVISNNMTVKNELRVCVYRISMKPANTVSTMPIKTNVKTTH